MTIHPILIKGCVSLDPSKISKSGWWGLQLDTWQLCNSLWYGLINSKLHINKNYFFISHNIRRCHTSNVLNHPADLSGMDLTSDPSWFTHSPWKASTKRYNPQIFKGSLLFSLSTANKMKQILCVIWFDTKWLSVLFKTVILQSDDLCLQDYCTCVGLTPQVTQISSKQCRITLVKVTVTWSHYHIRAADAGLLKIDRCWASSPVLDNKSFIFVESVHLQG